MANLAPAGPKLAGAFLLQGNRRGPSTASSAHRAMATVAIRASSAWTETLPSLLELFSSLTPMSRVRFVN